MPLTVAAWDGASSTARAAFGAAGWIAPDPAALEAGDPLSDSPGPLGMPTLTARPAKVCAPTKLALDDIASIVRACETGHGRGTPPVGVFTKGAARDKGGRCSAGSVLVGAADSISSISQINPCSITIDEVAASIVAARLRRTWRENVPDNSARRPDSGDTSL